LAQALSYDEAIRAGRFRFERDRRRFVVARGVLRIILGRYTGFEPSQLRFRYGERGKPYLSASFGSYTLHFNVSHSHELALYAVTRDYEVGVDLEYIRPIPDAEQIAERFFSTRENVALRAIPVDLKYEAFFTCWTRKEAYIKARGEGLSLPLDQFDVSLAPGEPARLLHTRDNPQEARRWSLVDVAPDSQYAGAVAIQGHGWQIRCWEWAWMQEQWPA
jgi:4'-phosphopantetheinyl transferase